MTIYDLEKQLDPTEDRIYSCNYRGLDVLSEGHVLVAVPGSRYRKPAKDYPKVHAMLSRPKNCSRVSVKALKKWAGTPLMAKEFRLADDVRAGWFGEMLVNRNLLAWALQIATGSKADVALPGGKNPLRIYGKGWIIVAMPMAANPGYLEIWGIKDWKKYHSDKPRFKVK